MIFSVCFYIDSTRWFKEQFELSRCLFNQARYFFRDYYDKNKSIVNQNDLEKVLRTQVCNDNLYREKTSKNNNKRKYEIIFTNMQHQS